MPATVLPTPTPLETFFPVPGTRRPALCRRVIFELLWRDFFRFFAQKHGPLAPTAPKGRNAAEVTPSQIQPTKPTG